MAVLPMRNCPGFVGLTRLPSEFVMSVEPLLLGFTVMVACAEYGVASSAVSKIAFLILRGLVVIAVFSWAAQNKIGYCYVRGYCSTYL